MSEQIRAAAQADVAAMTTLASIRREQYARYQPLFWRPAADAQDTHRPHLARLVAAFRFPLHRQVRPPASPAPRAMVMASSA